MNRLKEHVPLHTIKTKDMRSFGFDVMGLTGGGKKEYDSSVHHRHTFYELFLFTGGKARHEIDFQNFDAESGSVHFVSPGQIHHLDQKQTSGYVICFTEEFISLNKDKDFTEKFPYYGSANPPLLKLSEGTTQELEMLVKLVQAEMQGSKNTEVLRSYLLIILLKLREIFLNGKKTSDHILPGKKQKVLQFKKLINQHYRDHIPVAEYASRLNVSPNHLNALCRKHEGRSAIQLIQERLLLESKRLLYATDMNIKEISHYLRFEDVSYFNRFFKKQTELTPIQYREQISK